MTQHLTRLLILGVLWCLITDARAESWIVGIPVVAAATAAGAALTGRPRWRWSLVGFARFVPYFLHGSFVSGVDVAWRSVHPQLPIQPELVEYPMHLPDATARVFFMNALSLFPGTVTADVRDEVLTIHVVDGRQPVRQRLERLERAVAALFDVPMTCADDQGDKNACL